MPQPCSSVDALLLPSLVEDPRTVRCLLLLAVLGSDQIVRDDWRHSRRLSSTAVLLFWAHRERTAGRVNARPSERIPPLHAVRIVERGRADVGRTGWRGYLPVMVNVSLIGRERPY